MEFVKPRKVNKLFQNGKQVKFYILRRDRSGVDLVPPPSSSSSLNLGPSDGSICRQYMRALRPGLEDAEYKALKPRFLFLLPLSRDKIVILYVSGNDDDLLMNFTKDEQDEDEDKKERKTILRTLKKRETHGVPGLTLRGHRFGPRIRGPSGYRLLEPLGNEKKWPVVLLFGEHHRRRMLSPKTPREHLWDRDFVEKLNALAAETKVEWYFEVMQPKGIAPVARFSKGLEKFMELYAPCFDASLKLLKTECEFKNIGWVESDPRGLGSIMFTLKKPPLIPEWWEAIVSGLVWLMHEGCNRDVAQTRAAHAKWVRYLKVSISSSSTHLMYEEVIDDLEALLVGLVRGSPDAIIRAFFQAKYEPVSLILKALGTSSFRTEWERDWLRGYFDQMFRHWDARLTKQETKAKLAFLKEFFEQLRTPSRPNNNKKTIFATNSEEHNWVSAALMWVYDLYFLVRVSNTDAKLVLSFTGINHVYTLCAFLQACGICRLVSRAENPLENEVVFKEEIDLDLDLDLD